MSCLVDRISDTLSQGYTNLQSLVKCLDHAQYAVKQGCVRLRVTHELISSSFVSTVRHEHDPHVQPAVDIETS